MNQNIKALIDSKNLDLTCIEAKNKKPLTYAKLINQVNYTNTVLSKVGIKKNGRVAVVLDNGPAMASLFISVASCACIAPLNPAYKKEEFRFYLGKETANKTIGALQFLFTKLQNGGRRRLVSHDLNCKCVGADENCFAQLVTRSTYTDKNDAILIGILLTDADLAPELVCAAEDFAQGVQALLKIIGEVTRDSKSEKKVLYN